MTLLIMYVSFADYPMPSKNISSLGVRFNYYFCNLQIVEYLIKNCGADVEQKGEYEVPDDRSIHKVTPLWCAAVAGEAQGRRGPDQLRSQRQQHLRHRIHPGQVRLFHDPHRNSQAYS